MSTKKDVKKKPTKEDVEREQILRAHELIMKRNINAYKELAKR